MPDNRVPLSQILQDPDYQAAAAQDPAGAAAFISSGLQSGSYYDDRAPTGRGGGVRNPNTPGGAKLLEQLKGAPMGISNSAARTVAGTSDLLGRKLFGEGVDPNLLAALQPRPNELLGNALGDMGQLAAGGAALKIPMLGGTAPGLRAALTRAIGQGGKAALESGALTGLQSGGDTAAMTRDAGTAGLLGGGLSLAASTLKGGGKWLASTPFKAKTPEQQAILDSVIMPKMLGGLTPPSLESVGAATSAERSATGAAYGAAKKAAPPVPSMAYKTAVAEPRGKFAYPSTPVKMQDPRNPNFVRFPVAQDMAIMPPFQAPVAQVDEEVRRMLATKGAAPGLSIENISKQRSNWDKMAQDTFDSGLPDASSREAVARAYADALRTLEHGHAGGMLKPTLAANSKAITADELTQRAIKDAAGTGGGALRGTNFRRMLAIASAAAAPLNPSVTLGGMAIAYPAQTGWGMNRVGQFSNLLSSAPAVRAIQDTQTKTKKKN